MKTDWLNSIEKEHFSFLRKEKMFPMVCTISSHLLASYFEGLTVIYGTFGPNHLFHSWVEYQGDVIDLVQFQFLTHKLPFKNYQRLTINELISYALKHQETFVFSKKEKTYQSYHTITEVIPIFSEFKAQSKTYQEFLNKVEKSDVFLHESWQNTPVKNEKIVRTFKGYLEEQNLRITKCFFTKWAIVSAS